MNPSLEMSARLVHWLIKPGTTLFFRAGIGTFKKFSIDEQAGFKKPTQSKMGHQM
jgi:hypothetical protein